MFHFFLCNFALVNKFNQFKIDSVMKKVYVKIVTRAILEMDDDITWEEAKQDLDIDVSTCSGSVYVEDTEILDIEVEDAK